MSESESSHPSRRVVSFPFFPARGIGGGGERK
jgi:hypothetical protein